LQKPKNKVLILGDGLLGSEISNQTNWDCISRKKDGFDINDKSTYHIMTSLEYGAIQYCKYDIIINCIAATDTYNENKNDHWNTNYKGAADLVDFCNRWNLKLVHISTDYIYSNSISNASEETVPVHCNNWYGYTKLLGDGYVQLKSNDYLIIRCTHKPNPFPYEAAWIDQVGNFDYVDKIAHMIINLVDKEASGIYNVGTDLKSMYELASKTSNVYASIKPSHVPGNTSMNTTKLKSIL